LREGEKRDRPRNKTKEENSIAGPNLMVLRFCQMLEKQAKARSVPARISHEKMAQVHEGGNVIWPWVQSKIKRSLNRSAQAAKMVRQERVKRERLRKERRQFCGSPFSTSSESPIKAVLKKLEKIIYAKEASFAPTFQIATASRPRKRLKNTD